MSMLGQDQHPGVIVSGFHRSGTSLLAGLLHRAGVHMGDSLYGPLLSNQDGHYEHSELVELHDAILARQGASWQFAGLSPPELEGQDWAAMQLLASRRRQSPRPWGMKDPRLALFAEAWRRVLPQANWLVIYRHPAECHDSFGRRHSLPLLLGQGHPETDLRFWQEPDLAWRMWLAYHRILLAAIEKVDASVLVLSHQALLDGRSKDALARISALLGRDLEPHAGSIRRDWSASSLCQPPLDTALAREVEGMWTHLAQRAGELADLRPRCTSSSNVPVDGEGLKSDWASLLARLPRPQNPGQPATPVTLPDALSVPQLALKGPKDALAQAEQAATPALRHAILSTGVELFPGNVWLHNALGLSHRDRGDLENAEACFAQAAQLGPEFPGIWRQLAYVAAARRRFEDALAYLRPAWPLAANNAGLLAELCVQAGNFHMQLKDNRQAVLHAANAVKLRPDWPPAKQLLDRLKSADDDRMDLGKLEAAYHSGQTDADVVLQLASMLIQYGRMVEAKEMSEAFLAAQPNHRGGRRTLVAALRGLGEHELAKGHELALWRDILTDPGCVERLTELATGLSSWATQDLQAKLAAHLERILPASTNEQEYRAQPS